LPDFVHRQRSQGGKIAARVFQIPQLGQLSGRGNPADKAYAQRDSFLGIEKARRLAHTVVNGVFAAGNQMQAARLVRASWSLGTTLAKVAFSDQPGFHANKFRVEHGRAMHFFHHPFKGPLLGNVEQQIRRNIGIESSVIAIVTGGFHKEIYYPLGDDFSTHKRVEKSIV
jgi:hypothetical protein